jgi:hypothetical protein
MAPWSPSDNVRRLKEAAAKQGQELVVNVLLWGSLQP